MLDLRQVAKPMHFHVSDVQRPSYSFICYFRLKYSELIYHLKFFHSKKQSTGFNHSLLRPRNRRDEVNKGWLYQNC